MDLDVSSDSSGDEKSTKPKHINRTDITLINQQLRNKAKKANMV